MKNKPLKVRSRLLKSSLLVAIILLVTVWCAPMLVEASGGLLSSGGTTAQHDKLTGIIIHDGKERETLILRLDFQTNSNSPQTLGWVMPVPSKPKVSTISPNVFTRFRDVSTPKKSYLTELFGSSTFKKAATVPPKPVENTPVIAQSRVGIYDITIVSAYEQQSLKEWGAKNGYNLNVLYTPALREYVTQGWYFVIARISPDKGVKLQAGYSQPIALTFNSAEVIYPWRLAAYGTDGTVTAGRLIEGEFYLLKPDTRVTPQTVRSELRETYAESLSEETSLGLLQGIDSAATLRYFLTTYTGVIDARNIEEADLKFSNAFDQVEFNSGKINGTDWLWAALGTLFYGPLALFMTLWTLFSNTGTGLVIACLFSAIIYGFLKAEKTRPITALILVITGGLLAIGITIGAVTNGTPMPVLISIFVTGTLTVWAVWHNFSKIKLVQPEVD